MCNKPLSLEELRPIFWPHDKFNKLTAVFHASALLLIMNDVIISSDPMSKFVVNNRTDT